MSLVKHEGDAGVGLDGRGWESVWWACRGETITIRHGAWDLPARVASRDDLLGWVVVSGLICREVGLRDRYLLELLGPCEVVQPPNVPDTPRLGGLVRLTAATETTLMVLGRSFLRASARWPGLLAVINRALEAQRQRLAIQAAIAHLPRAEHRLLLQMWHLADRWGRVTPEGTVIALPLTHDLLGHLAAARRSTTTLALGTLEAEGVIRRLDDGAWLLTPVAEMRVNGIARTTESARVLGDTLKLRQRASAALEEARALQAEARQIRARGGRPRLK